MSKHLVETSACRYGSAWLIAAVLGVGSVVLCVGGMTVTEWQR
jgi:hypothetical protein